MRSNLVKISSQKISETLKISLPQFNLLKWYQLPWQYIKYVEIPVLVACQWSRMLTWFPIICISHFSLSAVFYMHRLRSGTDLITCEAELHGSVTRMVSSILSLVGAYTAWWQLYKNWTETVFSWPSATAAAFGTMVENCSSGLLGWFAVRGNPSSLFRLVSKIIK